MSKKYIKKTETPGISQENFQCLKKWLKNREIMLKNWKCWKLFRNKSKCRVISKKIFCTEKFLEKKYSVKTFVGKKSNRWEIPRKKSESQKIPWKITQNYEDFQEKIQNVKKIQKKTLTPGISLKIFQCLKND